MVDNMNRKTAAILMRGQIPVREEPTEEQRQAMQARQAAVAQQAAQAIAEERARQRIAVQEAAPGEARGYEPLPHGENRLEQETTPKPRHLNRSKLRSVPRNE